jgi:hypothetical protein
VKGPRGSGLTVWMPVSRQPLTLGVGGVIPIMAARAAAEIATERERGVGGRGYVPRDRGGRGHRGGYNY